ncbi:MAG: Asp-tRNA(Asn)/Glu-tRNA(Gln) amidotransferase GatCAB subunit C [Bacteroidetes bacterium]|nr:Asp-tRNA(Asn)/Glu-tRNA(Gln) amidotransferase subunit GatC [Bacteroidia bacterium]PCH69994.1 MAG: Asp-tRNA(Asn)/Glu-tRNA(Gln) amidotransferase GatCAB subunit C [Bacteroidota bacterium]
MEIDDKMVDNLARLAKLEYDRESKEEIKNDLKRILDLIDKLQEVDTTGVEPLVYMTDEENVLRDDVVKQEITRQEALKNAPKKDSDYFKVPKVLNKE